MQVQIDQLGSVGAMLLLRMLRGEPLDASAGIVLTPTLTARGTTLRPEMPAAAAGHAG
jgi:DNA-binding LacI/PurR family transcriptional regulator